MQTTQILIDTDMPTAKATTKTQLNKSPTEKIKVACIGDSITELSGYPELAEKALGSRYEVGNFGACGTTVSLNSEYPYKYSEAFDQAKRFQPNIAVIMLGTNDANSASDPSQVTLKTDLLTLIEDLKASASEALVYLVKPPPIFSEWGGLSGEVLIKEVIPAIEQTAEELHFCVIDLFSALTDRSYFFDGVHPNGEGAKIMADVICQAITEKDTQGSGSKTLFA
ncbi:MAG: GDSL-type esterase/lipase family protein [Methanocella sp.]|jgi:acyl-CoA thioesterase-1